ncbi:hypothetical protein P3X46_032248 [Hevea brasiliensis]|uniref:Uncharacterized protein n=2 Tax=Hevea brasiliensis TaxID=3981 RepID=A0A6A6MA30_HEVBR|nr:uncharacterized protein LOC110637951 [Hevea brasiliensis]KAF2308819.1 hypothetical protein GH714_020718 [Hevea brasiliensis]KAJ9135024.1 hypothetical protein P3X46_032248 [Hevea brasiliensis]
MQRQSLGSTVSKYHSHGGGAKDDTLSAPDDSKRRDLTPSSLPDCNDEEHHKETKLFRRFSSSSPSFSLSSAPPNPEKLVHFIPLLTFLCFFVLYLVSHSPSQSDLAQFNGFKRSSKHIDSTDNSGVGGGLSDVRRSDVLAIRSLRNLQEIKRASLKSRSHRKIANF